jgi:hypothetical protein
VIIYRFGDCIAGRLCRLVHPSVCVGVRRCSSDGRIRVCCCDGLCLCIICRIHVLAIQLTPISDVLSPIICRTVYCRCFHALVVPPYRGNVCFCFLCFLICSMLLMLSFSASLALIIPRNFNCPCFGGSALDEFHC